MPKFVAIESAVGDSAFADYLKKSKLGNAKKGGTFVGNYEVASDDFRSYGIVLPKGGMIIPDADPERVKKAIREAELDSLQKKMEDWKARVENEVLPELKERLISATGTDRNLRVEITRSCGLIYGKVLVDGLSDWAGPRPLCDYSEFNNINVNAVQIAFQCSLEKILQAYRDEIFLAEHETRMAAFQKIIDANASILYWNTKGMSIHAPGEKGFDVFVRKDSGELASSNRTPEELESIVQCLRSAKEDRARNKSRVAALKERVNGTYIVLPDRDTEEYPSNFSVLERDTYIEFNAKYFHWSTEGVRALEAEIDAVEKASDEMKQKIRSLLASGMEIERHTVHARYSGKMGGTSLTVYCFNGEVLSPKAVGYVQSESQKVQKRK